MRWNTVLFDLDGTVTDPKEGITCAVAYALRQQGRNFERNLAVHIQSVRFKNALEHKRIAQWRKVQMGRPGPLEQLLNLAGQFFQFGVGHGLTAAVGDQHADQGHRACNDG